MITKATSEPGPTPFAPDQVTDWCDKKASDRAARASAAGHASGRRRRIDPTTCDRAYSVAEMEFMQAIQCYKQASGRMFPTWSEVLEVLVAIGYQKGAEARTPGLR